MAGKNRIGGRIFEIVCTESLGNPDRPDWNKDVVREILGKYRSIKRYAMITHDKDTYRPEEFAEHLFQKKFNQLTEGEKREAEQKYNEENITKPAHLHVVMEMGSFIDLDVVAKWFGVAPNFVEMKKGRNAFVESVLYLTHEDDKQQDEGKYLYPDSEVEANFNFRMTVNRYLEKRMNGVTLSDCDRLALKVFEGMSLREACEEDAVSYTKCFNRLKQMRGEYLSKKAKRPNMRFNIYIYGESGVGKDLAARAVARSLFGNKPDDEIFFVVGAENAEFEGYDGQPVLIWEDVRAKELVDRWTVNGLFAMMNPFPDGLSRRENVKYGSTMLINSFNIMTGISPYREFFRCLCGEKTYTEGGRTIRTKGEEVTQAYRRFPMILPMRDKVFDVLLNAGYWENTTNWESYYLYKTIVGNYPAVARMLSCDEERLAAINAKLSQPVIEAIDACKKRIVRPKTKEEMKEIEEQLKDFGRDEREVELEKKLKKQIELFEKQQESFKNLLSLPCEDKISHLL